MPKIYETYKDRTRAEMDRFNMSNNLTLADAIRRRMRDIGFGYSDVCREANISNGTLSKVIHEPQKAKLSTIQSVCNVLGLVVQFNIR